MGSGEQRAGTGDGSDGAAGADGPAVDHADLDAADEAVLDRLHPAFGRWWRREFSEVAGGGLFTPPQREAIPLVDEGRHALVAAPTGSGKTLAAFSAVLDDLVGRRLAGDLADGVHCVYVSPMKALANDIHRNLEVPLEGIEAELRESGAIDPEEALGIRHAIRHGDTDDATRRAMLETPPHILVTTPETLAILLCAKRFREALATVEYVVVDEIHSLADGKRGTHLSVSLERLENLAERSPTRIGCSATVEPLESVADFLVGREGPGGPTRPREVVDARFARTFDLEVRCPVADPVAARPTRVQDAFYDQLADLVAAHENTIVFTNSRAGAERVLYNLRDRVEWIRESNSACHHGSLGPDRREAVEAGLKAGDFDVVTTSTSLELGVDMPHVDLVVQVGSPKSTAALLQRIGRAGHRVGQAVKGRVFAMDRDELVECAVMAREAARGSVDRVRVPERAQDVAAQHVYGMAIEGPLPEGEVLATLQRAWPYRDYTRDDFESLLEYLTGIDELEARNVYAKVWRDANDPPGREHHHPEYDPGEVLVGKRGRLARPIYLTNVGTIPDGFACDVLTRGEEEWVGTLDEDFLNTLETGDVFVLGGERFSFRYRRGAKVYVDPTDERPSVPTWYAERRPLSPDLATAIREFQAEIIQRLVATDTGRETPSERGLAEDGTARARAWLREFPIDDRAARALARLYAAQLEYAGPASVSTPERLAVEVERDREAYQRRYYVHAPYGRRLNEGLSRILVTRCAEATEAQVTAAVDDQGFVVSMPLNRKVDVVGLLADLEPGSVRSLLRRSLEDTDLLQRYFRLNATRSLLVLKRYKGYERSAGEQQVTAEMLLGVAEDVADFAVMDETYRELLEDRFRVDTIEEIVAAITSGAVSIERVPVDSPSPLSFGLATLADSDVFLAGESHDAVQRYHERVRDAIADGD